MIVREVKMSKQTLMVGAGCFWGVELSFSKIPGVTSTAVGYAGGQTDAPTYEDVCRKNTGHAEVVLIEFDDEIITKKALLEHFFKMHDPTTLNRQGPDVGSQYRSVVFVESEEDAILVETAIQSAQVHFSQPIVTAIESMATFWRAEEYHQAYFMKRGINQGCH